MASDNVSIGRFNLDGIAPAQRGTPQVEVTFDIDADGLLKVSAKDKGTGKEHHITITGRSGLDDSEIEKLVNEAAEHAEEDKTKRERIDAKNLAESTMYSAEKLLEENSDKATEDQKASINLKIETVKNLIGDENSSTESLTEVTNELQTVMQELGQTINSQPENNDNNDPKDDNPDSDTIEGEFKEV